MTVDASLGLFDIVMAPGSDAASVILMLSFHRMELMTMTEGDLMLTPQMARECCPQASCLASIPEPKLQTLVDRGDMQFVVVRMLRSRYSPLGGLKT